MAEFMTHFKKAAWTEAEVGVIMAGGVLTARFLDDTKIFKDQFAKNPAWFQGSREGAPFYIKWSGGIKALGALTAATYVKNPWIKLLLMGVALHGTLQQVRVITYDKTKGSFRVDQIGYRNQSELDTELRRLAEQHRGMNGPVYIQAPEQAEPLSQRYDTAVAYAGNRYESAVAGVYDELGFNFMDSDSSGAA